jgi:hypothetical protein
MAITGTVLTVQPAGSPALTPAGQIVFGPGDVQEPAFVATYTFIGDGTSTTIPVNWIDGTQTLPFTPKGVVAFAIPALSGTADTAGVLKVEGLSPNAATARVSSITNTSANLVYTTSVASGSTASVLLVVYR